MEPGKKHRVLLALPLGTLFLQEIGRFLSTLRGGSAGIKWVLPEQVHITLHFFGDVDLASLGKIPEIVRPIAERSAPMRIAFEKVGYFPDSHRPQVIWLGIKGDVLPLMALQEAMIRNLSQGGFPVEKRAFVPHATLGRVRRDQRKVFLNPAEFPETEFRTVTEIILFNSVLTSEGPQYEKLEIFPLPVRSNP